MDGRLILGLLWLACVRSEGPNNLPIEEASMASGTAKSTGESTSVVGAPSTKAKRYLSHQHPSPCPPFYPHVDMHMPMYAMRPYGPPAYPKVDYHMPMHHAPQQSTQYIHQQSYSSYAPKQTVQYIKQVAPVYHHPVAAPPIQPVYKQSTPIQPVYKSILPVHHVPAIQPVYKQSPPIQPVYKSTPIVHHAPIQPVYKSTPPVFYHHDKQPVFAYAPAYHRPMPMIWQAPQIKVDYSPPQIAYHKPAVVYKPEPPKCAPCSSPHQNQIFHQPQPSISYVKVAQPVVHQVEPAQHYVPAPVHQPIVKPCDK